ncbi:MAG TPA: putative 2OG-Fe(II) oxygenase [Casimicrobiaceae bacterium]|nr:putative 2OG-Fe(II) oxygenase [Casimicrobiaceae bacterium]
MAEGEAVGRSDFGGIPRSIRIGDASLATWPDGQRLEVLIDRTVVITRFADVDAYHPALLEAVVAARADARFVDANPNPSPWACGFKVRNLPQWPSSAALLVHARALALAHQVMERGPVYADDTWASIYRAGDYCMPHSHLRCDASVVYMLDPGDTDPADEAAGKLMIMDPRLAWCCSHEPGRATRPLMPLMEPGHMIAFAGECVHSVTPCRGSRPRITMSWNMTRTRLPGEPRRKPQR